MGNYSERVEIRLTPEQKEELSELAIQQELNVSELIRQRLLGEKPSQLKGLKREIYNELSRLGNNLNQIAKVLNSTALSQLPLPATEIIDLKGDLTLTIKEIKTLQVKLEQ